MNVASAAQASIDFDDVMLERRYDGLQAYAQSKLADVMMGRHLATIAAACPDAGRLVLSTSAGKLVVGAGDIVHLRPH